MLVVALFWTVVRVGIFVCLGIGLLRVSKTRMRHVPTRRTRIPRHQGETTLWLERLVNAVIDLLHHEHTTTSGKGTGVSSSLSSSQPSPPSNSTTVEEANGKGPAARRDGAPTGDSFDKGFDEDDDDDEGADGAARRPQFLLDLEERVNAILEDSGIAVWADFRIRAIGTRPPKVKAIHIIHAGMTPTRPATSGGAAAAAGTTTAASGSGGGAAGNAPSGADGPAGSGTATASSSGGGPAPSSTTTATNGGGGGSPLFTHLQTQGSGESNGGAPAGLATGASDGHYQHRPSNSMGGDDVTTTTAAAPGASFDAFSGGRSPSLHASGETPAQPSPPLSGTDSGRVGGLLTRGGTSPGTTTTAATTPPNTAAGGAATSPTAHQGRVPSFADGSSSSGGAPASTSAAAASNLTTMEFEAEVEYSGSLDVSLRADLSFLRGRQLPVQVRVDKIKYLRAHIRGTASLHYETATMDAPSRPFALLNLWVESDPAFDITLRTSVTRMRIRDFFLIPVLVKILLLRMIRAKLKRSSGGPGISLRVPLPADIVDGGELWGTPSAYGPDGGPANDDGTESMFGDGSVRRAGLSMTDAMTAL